MKDSKYNSAVENLLRANPDGAAVHIRNLRADAAVNSSSVLQQKLASFRVAIKIGNASFLNENELSSASADTPFLKAETQFVRGVILIHKQQFAKASEEFLKSADCYLLADCHDKSLLGRFNAMMAKSNGSLFTEQEELNTCNEILTEARTKSIMNIQALCLRQKSYIYYNRQKYLAALEEIRNAIPLFESHGPISDYHLAVVHAADCALEIGDLTQARVYLEYLPADLDSRLEFPNLYINAKIEKGTLNLSLFENASSHWKNRYMKYHATLNIKETPVEKYYWSRRTGLIVTENRSILGKIKFHSLEAQLLNILMQSPRSKDLICETLWPDYSTSENLDDRFFALKSRITQKIGNRIQFDGKNYSLTINLVKMA